MLRMRLSPFKPEGVAPVTVATDPTLNECPDATAPDATLNSLWGEITAIHAGPASSEVTLTLPGGRTLTAVVARDDAAHPGLAIGSPACGAFEANAVILAVFD